jgi:hypothetical protein
MAAEGGGDVGDAGPPQEIEHRIATGGEIGRGAVRTHLAGVFAQDHIAYIVQAVLNLPVPAPRLLQPGGIRLLRREAGEDTGDGKRPFLADGTGLGAADHLSRRAAPAFRQGESAASSVWGTRVSSSASAGTPPSCKAEPVGAGADARCPMPDARCASPAGRENPLALPTGSSGTGLRGGCDRSGPALTEKGFSPPQAAGFQPKR